MGGEYKKSKHPDMYKKKAKRAFDSMSKGKSAWEKQIGVWENTVKKAQTDVKMYRSMLEKNYVMAMTAASTYSTAVGLIIVWEQKLDQADARPFPDEPTVKKAKAELAKLEKRADKAREDYNSAKTAFLTEFNNVVETSRSIQGMSPPNLTWWE